jgi:hypothetical protein
MGVAGKADVSTAAERSSSLLTAKGLLRVPEITVVFWLIKGLSTAMGESTSDFLCTRWHPNLRSFSALSRWSGRSRCSSDGAAT